MTIETIDNTTNLIRSYEYEDVSEHYGQDWFEWLEMRNEWTFPFGGIFRNSSAYYLDYGLRQNCDAQTWRGPWRVNSFTTAQSFNIFFNFISSGEAYGHIILDYLPVLSMISEEMRHRAYFMVYNKALDFARNAMELFGIQRSHIIPCIPGETVFAARMYIVKPIRYVTFSAVLFLRFRAELFERLGLKVSKPSRYVIMNRGDIRRIANIGELLDFCANTFPNHPFMYYRCDRVLTEAELPPGQGWAEKIYLFNQFLFLFAVHSSGSLNAMFMQPRTVTFIVETDFSLDHIFPHVNRIFLLQSYRIRDHRFKHGNRKSYLDYHGFRILEIFKEAVEKAMELERNWEPKRIAKPAAPVLYSDGTLRMKA